MFSKATFALALTLASIARAPATMNAHRIAPSQDGYAVNNRLAREGHLILVSLCALPSS